MLTFSASDLLLMGCTPIFFQCVYVEGDVCLILKNSSFLFLFKKIMQFANYLVCACISDFSFLFFLRQTDTLLYVALLLKSLLL